LAAEKGLRIEQGHAMTLVGLSHHYAGEMGVDAGSEQWSEFMSLEGKIASRKDDLFYGACLNGDSKGNMDYLCAVEVTKVNDLPAELTSIQMPARKYAVFTHTGNISGIQQSWKRLFGLLREAKLREEGDVSFERYDSRFDPETGDGDVEIWVPVG